VQADLRFDPSILGKTLWKVRSLLRISVRQLARITGISHSQILRIESGEFDCLASSLIRLCGPLGIQFSDLLERSVLPDYEVYEKAVAEELAKGTPEVFPQDEQSKRAIKDLVLGGSIVLSYLLRASHPDRRAAEFDYPTKGIEERFHSIGVSLANCPPGLMTRFEFLRRLTSEPLEALRRFYRFPTPEDVAAHAALWDRGGKRLFYPWLPLPPPTPAFLSLDEQKFFSSPSLTAITGYRNSSGVRNPLGAMISRLKLATEARGKKAELATYMGVPLPRISEWLSGRIEPGGAATLRLLQWVEQQEAKQTKSSGSAATRPERQTRRKASLNETKTSSPQRRYPRGSKTTT
jgi:transcriptional regulator with XRE-family HTH domain